MRKRFLSIANLISFLSLRLHLLLFTSGSPTQMHPPVGSPGHVAAAVRANWIRGWFGLVISVPMSMQSSLVSVINYLRSLLS